MVDNNEERKEMLRRLVKDDRMSRLSREDMEMLSDLLAEPISMEHVRYMLDRSNIEVLRRLRISNVVEQIHFVQALRATATADYDKRRLLDEAYRKLAEIREILGSHIDTSQPSEDRVEFLGLALEIITVLDRPDDPWEGQEDDE